MTVFRSQRVLTGGEIVPADVVIEHDRIVEVAPYRSSSAAHDFGSQLLVPGFVDLHSDAVEKEIEPRPGATFPIENALVELDKKLAMSGITTMFHAIAFNDEALTGRRGTEIAAQLVEAIDRCNQTLLSVDNLVHARYEITSFSSVMVLKKLIAAGTVQLFSLMDHSPGQGQFTSLAKWKEYHLSAFALSDQRAEEIVEFQLAKKNDSLKHIEELTGWATAHRVPIASHDDDRPEKIEMMQRLGITIAEFPLNIATADHARKLQIKTGMGAPNIVRGKSQSGNISARQLVEAGCCDFLCSDYHPTSLLQAVYTLHREIGVELSDAFAYVTATPAAIVGLTDRGRIAADQLADLLVIEEQPVPKVVLTIKAGKPVYSGKSCLCIS
ncbi:MAG: alpha-D-ribose 1-methylphosphonate 5-triphosphate diphosphatase [Desulforhopalus sp.]|jgi:alpha-D-ribose 1-methylphosphonate 5-triphosphate diphosphatase|nr:alpha-D-ribose 1-methylphosphonate 5-triphosphate diphosphatase [Desulforhopalus sp.]